MWNLFIRTGGTAFALLTWLLLCACADPSRAEENLIISEVMAVNRRTLADQNGEHSDWIEIFNPNSSSVNLESWYLTDDPKVLDKWRLPSAKIKGRGYLVIFASEKTRHAEDELHANFKLDQHGEYLALVRPDGATVSFEFVPGYPTQVSDVSYGIDPAITGSPQAAVGTNGVPSRSTLSKDHLQYFATPTPGVRNKDGLTGIAASPRILKPGGVYAKSVLVELSAPSPGVTIRYTIDGSEPNAASPTYTSPIEITATALLKARAFERGLAPSPTVAQTYTMADESMSAFTSNLPLVIIDTFGNRIGRDTRTPVTMRFIDAPNGKRAALGGPANFDGHARIHYRGYTSMRQPKRSFAVKTTDEAGEPLKVSILGMPKDNDWILYAPYVDKTMIRDAFAYELSNKMGHYAPRTRFVELFITRAGSRLSRRDYMGVYVFEEKIKRGKHRVDIAELRPTDNTEPNITGGYIFKKDHEDKGLPGFTSSQGHHFFYVEPKAEEIISTQRAWLKSHLNKFERALNSAQFRDPARGYPAYLDADSFIDNFWIVEMSKNIDGFRFSTFFQIDRGGKIKIEPIWDWNLSFGNAQGRGGSSPRGWYHQTLDDEQYSWYPRLFEDPDFAQKRIDRWAQLRRNLFAPENLLKRVDEMAAHLDEAKDRNFQRWPILGQHLHPNAYVGESYEDEINYMKKWIQRRIAWLDSQFPPPPSVTRKDGHAALHAPTGKIYFTLDGSDPRLPGGAVSPKAQAYGSAVKVNDNTKVVARAQQNGTWSAPAKL